MLIIFSGVDKVGKSTIINRLKSKMKQLQMIKFKGPHKRGIPVNEWASESIIFHRSILRFHESLERDNNLVLLDRFYPDEVVYSQVLRNKTLWYEYAELDKRFANIGTKFVYVKPHDLNVLKTRYETEELTKWSEVSKLLNMFEVFYEYTSLDKIVIDQNTVENFTLNFITNGMVGNELNRKV
jgi:thymidylate kinase